SLCGWAGGDSGIIVHTENGWENLEYSKLPVQLSAGFTEKGQVHSIQFKTIKKPLPPSMESSGG
ncbi:MAG: hypothetical protein JSW33_04830, partial [bacterium]